MVITSITYTENLSNKFYPQHQLEEKHLSNRIILLRRHAPREAVPEKSSRDRGYENKVKCHRNISMRSKEVSLYLSLL